MSNLDKFEVVSKADRLTPLQSNHPARCDHVRIYITDEYPTHGDRYVCADCGFGSGWLRDLE